MIAMINSLKHTETCNSFWNDILTCCNKELRSFISGYLFQGVLTNSSTKKSSSILFHEFFLIHSVNCFIYSMKRIFPLILLLVLALVRLLRLSFYSCLSTKACWCHVKKIHLAVATFNSTYKVQACQKKKKHFIYYISFETKY